VIYFVGAVGGCFSGVGVGGFQDRGHADFEGGYDVLVNSVAYVHYVLDGFAYSFGGDFEDSRVWLTEIEFVGIEPNGEKIQYARLFQMLFQRRAAYEGVGEYAEL